MMPSSGCEEDGGVSVSSNTSIQRAAALNPEVEAVKPQTVLPAFTHSTSVDQSCESTISKA